MKPPTIDEAFVTFKRFRLILAVSLSVLLIGTVIFHHLEHWSWIDAFYFCSVSLTTVGYGDLTPKTDAGKLITSLYLFIGISIIAALINNLLKGAVARRELKKQGMLGKGLLRSKN